MDLYKVFMWIIRGDMSAENGTGLTYLYQNQVKIEDNLYKIRRTLPFRGFKYVRITIQLSEC
ncbi:hypothetical protein FGG79_16045 [Bacillus sp. BHET2]|nr:hypothetical protein FGG79_16045 [Bacillus sp. BHET2]